MTAEPASISAARSWLGTLTLGLVAESRRADLELVFSEVVTNAVRHGAPGGVVRLAATPKPEFLCVQVSDEGAGFAPRPRAIAPDEHGGFGLFIVEHLTRRWGITRENQRTRVWFEFEY